MVFFYLDVLDDHQRQHRHGEAHDVEQSQRLEGDLGRQHVGLVDEDERHEGHERNLDRKKRFFFLLCQTAKGNNFVYQVGRRGPHELDESAEVGRFFQHLHLVEANVFDLFLERILPRVQLQHLEPASSDVSVKDNKKKQLEERQRRGP